MVLTFSKRRLTQHSPLSCDELPGMLRWNDWPDPLGGREAVVGRADQDFDTQKGTSVKKSAKASELIGAAKINSRAALSIENEKGLFSILQANRHRQASLRTEKTPANEMQIPS